jgi:hypothetical protein
MVEKNDDGNAATFSPVFLRYELPLPLIEVPKHVDRTSENVRVELLQFERFNGFRGDAASNLHPSERRTSHGDHVAVGTSRLKSLHGIAVLLSLSDQQFVAFLCRQQKG